MKKKNTNSFVAHLEDKEELFDEMERQHEKQINLQEETLDRMDKYQKGMIGVYVVIGLLLFAIIFFWWNISRGQFYAALNKPFDNSAVEKLLYEINTVKGTDIELGGETEIDWDNLLEQLKSEKGGELSPEEELALTNLVEQLQSGKSIQEVMSNLDELNLEE